MEQLEDFDHGWCKTPLDRSSYGVDHITPPYVRGNIIGGDCPCGGGLYLLRHGLELPDYRVFHGAPANLCSLRGIFGEAMLFRGRGLIDLGVMLLIATPVARVAFSIFGFMEQRDFTYVIVTLIVLILLLFSLSGGIC